MFNNRMWAVAGLCVAFTIAGCKEQGATSSAGSASTQSVRPRVALIMKARTNPFFQRMAQGAESAAKELNVDLVILDIDKETDTAAQAAKVESAVSQGAKVILIAPADSKAIVAPLVGAQAQGIRVINLDNRIDAASAEQAGLKIAAFIGPDNAEGARKSTEALIAAVGGEGKLALLEGIRGVDNAENRKRGFLEAVEATGGKITVAAMDTAEWATEPAQKKMEGMLNNHPDLKGVFCANDMMALGAIQAIAAAGRTGAVFVAGYDNIDAAKDALKAGTLVATVEQHPDKMGAMGVESALRLIQGEPIPGEIPVPTDLITAVNLGGE